MAITRSHGEAANGAFANFLFWQLSELSSRPLFRPAQRENAYNTATLRLLWPRVGLNSPLTLFTFRPKFLGGGIPVQDSIFVFKCWPPALVSTGFAFTQLCANCDRREVLPLVVWSASIDFELLLLLLPVSYTNLTLPTIYAV